MDSWECNKIAAAILGVLVFMLSVHFAAEALFTVPPADPPGYVPVGQDIPAELKPAGDPPADTPADTQPPGTH